MTFRFYADHIERFILPCFLVLLFWAPLPLGSNRLWSSLGLFISSAILLLFLLPKYFKNPLPYTFIKGRWPLLLLFTVQLFMVFQVVFGVHISPFQGVVAVLQGLSYCFAFTLTLLLITTKKQLQWFVYTVVFSALFQSIYGLLNVLFEWNYLFIIKKTVMQEFVTGTFVNRNHLAGYLNIGLAMGIGWMLLGLKKQQIKADYRQNVRTLIEFLFSRVFFIRMVMLLIVLGLIMTRSRAGNLAFIVALTGLAIVYFYKQQSWSLKIGLFFVSFIVLDALLIGYWFGFDHVAQRISQTSLETESRAMLNLSVLTALKDYFWLGSGVNSFDVLLPIYMQSQAHVPFEHAHNDFLELFMSLGFFGFACLAIFVVLIVRDNWNRRKPQYGVFMLVISTFMLSLFDFNLYIPAFAYTLCASLALAYFSMKRSC